MELAPSTTKGLQLLNDVSLIPDSAFQSLSQLVAQKLLEGGVTSGSIGPVDAEKGALKEAGAALSTLFLEAAKHDLSSTALSAALENDEVDDDDDDDAVNSGADDAERIIVPRSLPPPRLIDDRRDFLVKKYDEIKSRLRQRLSSIRHGFDVVSEARWDLECVVRDSYADRRGDVRFVVTLTGRDDVDDDDERAAGICSEPIRFACDVEQLQDLVAKLKNACKGLERVVQ